MKFLKSLLISFLILGCQETSESHAALGTWNYCTKDGNYEEFIITRDFLLVMSTRPKRFLLFKSEIIDSSIVISHLEGEVNLPTPTDTLIALENSMNTVVLKSIHSSKPIYLRRTEFEFSPIDWGSLPTWKDKVQSEFKKRAALHKCSDLRSDEEKKVLEINLEIPELLGEEVPMKNYPIEN